MRTLARHLREHSLLRYALAAVLVLFAVFGAGCQRGEGSSADSAAVATPASLTFAPVPNARDIDPLAPVAVTATSGTLTSVQMVNDDGKRIDGVLTPDNIVWHPIEPLGYGRTYTLTVASRGPGGKPATQAASFSTLSPPNQTKVYLDSAADAPLQDGGTYGVGTVIVAHFDEPITDRAAAERQLEVHTSPPVQGSWYWLSDQNAHWRPEHYYAPGTAVTVDAKIYGIRLGD